MPDNKNTTATNQGLTLEGLAAQMADLSSSHSAVLESNAKLAAENTALRQQLAKAPTPAPEVKPRVVKLPSDPGFTLDKKKYKFVVPVFNFNGAEITAEDALADDEILTKLVEMGSGLITAVK